MWLQQVHNDSKKKAVTVTSGWETHNSERWSWNSFLKSTSQDEVACMGVYSIPLVVATLDAMQEKVLLRKDIGQVFKELFLKCVKRK